MGRGDSIMDRVTKGAANLFLLGPWNQMWKEIGLGMIGREVQDLVQGRSLDIGIDPRTRLNEYGFTPDEIAELKRKFAEHDDMLDPSGLPNWESAGWSLMTRDAWDTMMAKQSGVTIATPGAGDMPVFSSDKTGQLLYQFMSFRWSPPTGSWLRWFRRVRETDG